MTFRSAIPLPNFTCQIFRFILQRIASGSDLKLNYIDSLQCISITKTWHIGTDLRQDSGGSGPEIHVTLTASEILLQSKVFLLLIHPCI